jgi:hypothetical protein
MALRNDSKKVCLVMICGLPTDALDDSFGFLQRFSEDLPSILYVFQIDYIIMEFLVVVHLSAMRLTASYTIRMAT